MAGTANQQAYGGQPWGTPQPGGGAWAAPAWQYGPYWHPWALHRGVIIAAMVLGFIWWWPIGLAILFGAVWSGRMGCWGRRQRMAYDNTGWQSAPPWSGWKSWCGPSQSAPTSGNRAFDEYRADTLRRLEEEQKDFGAFLDRLRFAVSAPLNGTVSLLADGHTARFTPNAGYTRHGPSGRGDTACPALRHAGGATLAMLHCTIGMSRCSLKERISALRGTIWLASTSWPPPSAGRTRHSWASNTHAGR